MKLNFLRPREEFLLLDVSPRETSALLLSVDEDRNLTPKEIRGDFSLENKAQNPLVNLRKRKPVVSAHHSLVSAAAFPLELRRERELARSPITLPELENLISRAIGKLFNERRAEAGKSLGCHELDAVLVNSRAENFKVDGRAVHNPAGFSGSAIGAVLELTFTAREVFERLKTLFNSRDGLFFTTWPRAALIALEKIQQPPFSLIVLASRDFFGTNSGEFAAGSFSLASERAAWGNLIFRKTFDWSPASVPAAIARSLGVGQETASAIYNLYLRNETSEGFRHAVMRIIGPELQKFRNQLKKIKPRGRAYIYSPLPLPFTFPFGAGHAAVHDLPLGQVLEKSGFKTDFSKWPMPENEIFARLAPFLEFYYDRSGSEINQRLRRRLHWLIQ